MRRSDTKYIITNDTWNAKLFLPVKLLINKNMCMKKFIKLKWLEAEFEEFRKAYSKKWHADYRKLIKVTKSSNK